jgi:hypothetical protein
MKNLSFLLLIVVAFTFSCQREIDILVEEIDPADAVRLSKFVKLPPAATRVAGRPPAPTGTGAPSVSTQNSQVSSSNGGTTPLRFTFTNGTGLAGCYVQIVGADQYFNIPYSGSSNATGTLTLPIGIPTFTKEGNFCVEFSVYDAQNRVSNIVRSCVQVFRLGSGAMQVNLTWDTNNTDVDLYVTEPNGNTIYYARSSSSTGGQLDRDDTNGYGPENIYWLQEAPDGDYKVSVNYYSGGPETNYYITINTPNKSKTFEGKLVSYRQTNNIVTVKKRGNTYEY